MFSYGSRRERDGNMNKAQRCHSTKANPISNVKAVQGRRVWLQDAKIFNLLSSMLLFGSTCMAMAQNAPNAPPLQSTETPGPHAVGLKVVGQYDYSRNFRLSTDETCWRVQIRGRCITCLAKHTRKRGSSRWRLKATRKHCRSNPISSRHRRS